MKYICSICRKSYERKKVKRINKEWICSKCFQEKRKEKRKNIKRNILKISKEQELEEDESIIQDEFRIRKGKKKKYDYEHKDKLREYHREYQKRNRKKISKYHKEYIERNKEYPKLKIKGSKIRKNSRQLHSYLTTEEKYILYRKYVRQGLNSGEVNERLKNIQTYLKEFIKKLREKKESEKIIEIKFKEEFAKLIEQEWMEKNCPYCGCEMKKLDDDAYFCPNCGIIKNQKESEKDSYFGYVNWKKVPYSLKTLYN